MERVSIGPLVSSFRGIKINKELSKINESEDRNSASKNNASLSVKAYHCVRSTSSLRYYHTKFDYDIYTLKEVTMVLFFEIMFSKIIRYSGFFREYAHIFPCPS